MHFFKKSNFILDLMNNALILTNGHYVDNVSKTAHGLVRGTTRFSIKGIIDSKATSGQDAGQLLDGRPREIPVYENLKKALADIKDKIDYLIIGVATKGGVLPVELKKIVKAAIKSNINIVNGLHQYLCDDYDMIRLARANNVRLIDIRKAKPFQELHFWSGKIKSVTCPIVAVLGTDCKMGKRTTAKIFTDTCIRGGIKAEMIYTGQTGWMQGHEYGFIFDSTPNDFIAGELEHAIVSCYETTRPKIIFLEGQSALRNPNGPCGAEFILSGGAKYVVLQHAPIREYFDNDKTLGYKIPSLESEIELIGRYGASVVGVTINSEGVDPDKMLYIIREYEGRLKLPVIDPLSATTFPILLLAKEIIRYHAH